MKRHISLASCAFVCAFVVSPTNAANNGLDAHACAARAQGVYGFVCQGSTFTGPAGFEPVTFIGTVEGNRDSYWEGYGTFNSSNGSFPSHVAGQATYGKHHCFGRVVYSTNEILDANGNVVGTLPPLVIDFVPVDNFNETLGMPVAGPGVSGDFVPRMTCRLVRTSP